MFLSWEEVVRFLPEVKNGFQLRYLIANKEKLSGYPNFQSVYAELVKNDPHWEWMKNTFAFSDSFIREHEANIQTFLEQGGSEILYEFYKEIPDRQKCCVDCWSQSLWGNLKT